MNRTSTRIEAAIRRAASRYFNTYRFIVRGTSFRIDAVKREATTDDLPTTGAAYVARRFEFVVSTTTFEAMKRATESFANASIAEERDGRLAATYRFDKALPYDENSPDGGSVRLYAYKEDK